MKQLSSGPGNVEHLRLFYLFYFSFRVELTFQPTAAIRSELDVSPTPDDSPLTSIADEFVRKQPSPFSAKKVIYKDEQVQKKVSFFFNWRRFFLSVASTWIRSGSKGL